jgi:hypothetical protein
MCDDMDSMFLQNVPNLLQDVVTHIIVSVFTAVKTLNLNVPMD